MEGGEEAYRLEVDKKFLDDLKNVGKETRLRVKELIDVLEANPLFIFNLDIKKLKGFENVYRLRIGKYRILFMLTRTIRQLCC